MPQPAVNARKEIIGYYLNKVKYASDVDVEYISRATSGMTGADIKNLVNTAVIHAVQSKRNEATKSDFDFAMDRLQIGILNKSVHVTTNTFYMTAVHEAGHAMVSLLNPNSTPMSKVTILSKGDSLGYIY